MGLQRLLPCEVAMGLREERRGKGERESRRARFYDAAVAQRRHGTGREREGVRLSQPAGVTTPERSDSKSSLQTERQTGRRLMGLHADSCEG